MLNVDLKNIIRKDQNSLASVLEEIKFEIMPAKIYTILGKNGSGKSTLIKSLTDLLNKNIFTIDGVVLFKDENIFQMNEERLLALRRKEVRYVLQDLTNNFDPLKKLKYYFDFLDFEAIKTENELRDFLLPDFLTLSQLYPYEISGGMAQRLSMLLAFIPNPKLVILDEPTSAIDYTNINLIKIKLDEHKSSGNSALIVTQDIQFAKEVSDEIAFLSNGTLSKFKSSDSFFAESEPDYSNFLKAFEELK